MRIVKETENFSISYYVIKQLYACRKKKIN